MNTKDEPAAKRACRLEQVLSEMAPEHARVVAAALVNCDRPTDESRLPFATLMEYSDPDVKAALEAANAANKEVLASTESRAC